MNNSYHSNMDQSTSQQMHTSACYTCIRRMPNNCDEYKCLYDGILELAPCPPPVHPMNSFKDVIKTRVAEEDMDKIMERCSQKWSHPEETTSTEQTTTSSSVQPFNDTTSSPSVTPTHTSNYAFVLISTSEQSSFLLILLILSLYFLLLSLLLFSSLL